jgi:hypothetical protein
MNLVWTWWGVPGTFALVAAWFCAIVALRTDPRRILNQKLSLILILEGLFAGGAMGLLLFFDNPTIVTALATVGTAALVALPFQYLSFLAVALDTPLVVPFRSRGATVLMGLASIVAAIFVIANPHMFISELYRPGWAPWNFQYAELGQRAGQLLGIVYLFGLIAAVAAYIRTRKGSIARNRAKWFAIAFGFRDVFVGIASILYAILRPVPFWGDFLYNPGQALAYSAYVLLLAYAVLRFQLFNIDLKIKFVLQQSTVAALIIGGFIVGSEVLESFVPVSGTVSNIVVAIAILIVLRPLQRLALSITDGLMRNVQNTPEYLEVRRLEVYRAALEGAFEDGLITDKERSILDRLRDSLGISQVEAVSLEKELSQ